MSIHYKVKKKRRLSDSRITLIAEHEKKIEEIDKTNESLPILKKKLKGYKKEVRELIGSNNNLGLLDTTIGIQVYEIEKKIKETKKSIKDIKNNTNKKEYYSNTSHILYNYYDSMKNITIKEDKVSSSIIDLLQKKKNNKNNKNNRTGGNRANLLDMYNKIIDPTKYKPLHNDNVKKIDMCKKCDVEMILVQSEGNIVCPNCGREEYILIDSDKPSYKDPPPDAGEFTYKRINRFDEWITQYQAKETTEIPQEVIDNILLEIKKENVKDISTLKTSRIRGYLKKLGLNKYYEHIPHIIYCINGIPTPKLSLEIEEKLRYMFRQIQDIFDSVCPSDRTNFLSYSYLLRKLLELLGEDEHKKFFRLHKSREKIYQHDKVWQKICKKLEWQYIRTI